jgi:HK97 family phage portal protein
VRPLLGDDGSIFYELANDKLASITTQVILPARAVLHDRAATFWHPLVGVSPLFAAGISAMTGARILMNSEKFFANMSRAGGVLTAPGKIDPALAKRLQAEWETNYGPKGLGRTAVLSNGLEFKPLTINAVDAALVEQLRWTVEDIARVYRVPGFKLGDLNKVSYRNSEQMARDYFQGCLSYHIEAMEQCFEAAYELADDVQIEFDLRPLFRMETDTRYETYGKALNAGFLSINEVRQEEDLPPVKGGEEPRVQAQYIPLSKATGDGVNVPGQPALPAPDSSDSDTDTEEPEDPEDDTDSNPRNAPTFSQHEIDQMTQSFMRSLTVGVGNDA